MAFNHPFYFLRHGETQWNKDGMTQGQLDAPLNDTGLQQAARAADILATEPIARILASPLLRARETAEAVAERHGLDITFDDGLMECHLGDHEGKPHGPWLHDYFMGTYDPPNGEPFKVYCDRVWGAMARAVEGGANTLMVAHGGLWIAAQQFVKVQPVMLSMPNALPVHVTPQKNLWTHKVLDPAR